MSELKVYKPYANRDGDVLIYHKGDGDLMLDDEDEIYLKEDADKVIAHNKYKRCVAMAMWCEATALWCYQAANTLPAGFHATLYGKPVMIEPARLFKRHELLTKWSARWHELAERFKEAK